MKKVPHIFILKKHVKKSYIRNPTDSSMNNEVHVYKIDKDITFFKTRLGYKEAMVTYYFLDQLKDGRLIPLVKKKTKSKTKTKTKSRRSHGKK